MSGDKGKNKNNPTQGRFHALVPRQDQVADGVVEGMFLIHNNLGKVLTVDQLDCIYIFTRWLGMNFGYDVL